MKNIWKNHKIKVIVTFYVAVSLLVMRFGVIPLINNIQDKANSIQETAIDDQLNRTKFSKIPEMDKDFGYYDGQKGSLDVVLDPKDEVEFIKKLEQIAQETGNTISLKVLDDKANASSPAAKTAKDKKDAPRDIADTLSYNNFISLEISLSGNYPGLVNFVNKLENDDYYVNILSLNLQKETQIEEKTDDANARNNSQFGIFIPPNGTTPNAIPEQKESKVEKDVLKSVLNVIVYTKK